MPHSFTHLLTHVIFATKDRTPDLTGDLAIRLFPYLGGILKELNARPFLINGPADHVHLLVALPPALPLAEMMRVLKSNSSRWVHEQFAGKRHFAWQIGYAAFAVSHSQFHRVRQYIAEQQEHHRRVSFVEELQSFLRSPGIEHEARDIWA